MFQGWNLTGDAYELDAEGYFHYRARTDDMIITAGYNVAGPEVEEVLLKHADVAECAVVICPMKNAVRLSKPLWCCAMPAKRVMRSLKSCRIL